MKNTNRSIFATALAGFFLLTSCAKSVDKPATADVSSVSKNLVSGTWVIASYSQRTEDKTSLYKDFVFTFGANNVLTADEKGTTTTGTWTYTPASVSYYGSTPSKASVALNLGTASPLARLNRTWNIDSTKTTATVLSLINPEPRDGEVLTFAKQ